MIKFPRCQTLILKVSKIKWIYLLNCLFSSYLKSADRNPSYKNVKKDFQESNRPVNILWTLSKVFGRIMFAQMSKFFDKILSKQHAVPGKAIVQKNTYCPSYKIGNMPFIGVKRSVLY